LRIEPPSEYSTKDLKLQSVTLTTDELVEFCTKANQICGPVSLVKKSIDGSKVILTDVEDIVLHSASIVVPFEIVTSGPEIIFSNFDVSISYKRSDSEKANTLFRLLKLHSPFLTNFPLVSSAAIALLAFVGGISIKSLGDFAPIERYQNFTAADIWFYLLITCVVILQLYLVPDFGLRVRVKLTRKTSFFQRNKDTIFISLGSILIGAAGTYFFGPIIANFIR
jgi:hypothetical protein